MNISHTIIHFVWLLPEHKDSNRHIRNMLISEVKYCSDLTVKFYSGEYYLQEVDTVKKPDLVILFGSFYNPYLDIYNLISQVRSRWNTYIAAWVTDDPYEFDCNYFLPKFVDFVFSNDKNSCNYYHSPNVYHLPLAAAESVHGVLEASTQPEWDFVFCGVGFPNRIDIIEGLQDFLKKYSTLIIGSNWSSEITSNLFIRPSVSYDELLHIYTNSKIVLNLSRVFDLQNKIYEIVPSTPAPRTFEVAAMGVFQLVFFDRPELYEYFSPEEIISFSTKEEFIYLAKKYLENLELRCSVARKAKQKIMQQHLYRHRLQTIIHYVFSSEKNNCH
ncbi:CgeB family protein [Calothrix sp. UHCC 0171]|uniref:CgeB family protein n=1 Tax=Calothrix sp. UHCC 0171 TaxID=3110245 RepID=UPI002B2104B4|nr:glycosyltransferase [Calothrix sp. UHCC 0171]MEA5569984.1 glycosyltransferase [Calothrix sp. UHCC 0171]